MPSEERPYEAVVFVRDAAKGMVRLARYMGEVVEIYKPNPVVTPATAGKLLIMAVYILILSLGGLRARCSNPWYRPCFWHWLLRSSLLRPI